MCYRNAGVNAEYYPALVNDFPEKQSESMSFKYILFIHLIVSRYWVSVVIRAMIPYDPRCGEWIYERVRRRT